MTKKEEQRIEQEAFEILADINPHEMYAAYPDLFWKYVHRRCPNVSRKEMEQILKETQRQHVGLTKPHKKA